jgi:hypothetical protein
MNAGIGGWLLLAGGIALALGCVAQVWLGVLRLYDRARRIRQAWLCSGCHWSDAVGKWVECETCNRNLDVTRPGLPDRKHIQQ